MRATSIPYFATWPSVVHTFWPLTIHSSPSRTARVLSPATSEPAPGSLKSWHQISSVGGDAAQVAVLLLLGAPLRAPSGRPCRYRGCSTGAAPVPVDHLVDRARLHRRERQPGAVLRGPRGRRVPGLADHGRTSRRRRAPRAARRAARRRRRRPLRSNPPAGSRAATRGSARRAARPSAPRGWLPWSDPSPRRLPHRRRGGPWIVA